MNRIKNIEIAKSTMKITEDFIRNQGIHCESVEPIAPEQNLVLNDEIERMAGATCVIVNADSYEAAQDLDNPLVMNFANAHRPGGGFLSGARAQEESLCRCSTLYKSISSDAAKAMYDYNNRRHAPCDSDYMLLSPAVYVFRDRTGEMLNYPYWVSVVTVAAPNRNGSASSVPQNVLDEVMKNRIRKMLILAASKGYKNLILGAWGCGAFGNDTNRVAEYFYSLLYGEEKLNEYFEKIVFAILGDEEKIHIFRNVFADVLRMQFFAKKQLANADSVSVKTEIGLLSLSCNYAGATEDNLGHTKGITQDGIPYEAELFREGDSRSVAIIMPRIFEETVGKAVAENKSKVTGIHFETQCMDNSILDIGMADYGEEDNLSVVQDYVGLLEDAGLVRFVSDVYNGTVFYRVDEQGYDLVKIIITLEEDGEYWAESDLQFEPFPDVEQKHRFTVIK